MMLQYRQDVKADKLGMAHTLLQTTHDVAAFRSRKPRMSVESLAGEYAKLNWVEEDDSDIPTSPQFIKSALFIHDRMLPVQAIKNLLVKVQEGQKQKPFRQGHKAESDLPCRHTKRPSGVVSGDAIGQALSFIVHGRGWSGEEGHCHICTDC